MEGLHTQPEVPLPVRRVDRADRAATLLAWCRSLPRRRDLVLLLLAALPVPLVMALQPRVALTYTHHDVFIPLDAAWRTLNGQWPHTDYYSPLGLSYAALHGAAAWLWGMEGRVVIRANLLALPFVLGAGLLMGWRRLPALSLLVLSAVLSVLVASPVFLDGPERWLAHLANYNRIGGGLCAALCIWALRPPARPSRALDTAEVVVAALTLLVLLTLKVTFFALAGVALAAGCCTVRGFTRRAALASGLAAAGALALEAWHPGFWLAYMADVRRAGAANTEVFRSFYALQAVLVNLPMAVLAGVLGVAAAWIAPRQRLAVAGTWGVGVACVLVATQNFGAFSPPLLALVMLLARRMEDGAEPGTAAPVLGMAGLAAVLLAAGPFLLTHAAGTAYHAVSQHRGLVVAGGRSDVLRTVAWLPNPIEPAYMPDGATPEEAARWHAILPVDAANRILEDGLDLLQRDGLAGRPVAALMFSNPFSAALGAPPPRGGALWWDENRTFTIGKLTPNMVLGEAEVVMVPKLWWQQHITTALLEVAGARLREGYVPHESRWWTAWVRPPRAP